MSTRLTEDGPFSQAFPGVRHSIYIKIQHNPAQHFYPEKQVLKQNIEAEYYISLLVTISAFPWISKLSFSVCLTRHCQC